jgi:glycosyltransferase involved in cell wall biosynthesis
LSVLKVSIITVVYNNAASIEHAINSVLTQDYPDIEHIIIDGASKDGTVELIRKHESSIAAFVSEPDKGIYDAMNKGLKLVTGEIVGTLNADDFYADNTIISQIVKSFENANIDSVFGDVAFVDKDNVDKMVRYYSSKRFEPRLFAYGYMPAHPSFFVKKAYYEKFGLFKTDYKIAADYELLIRFLAVNKLSYKYLPLMMVKMRTGGASNETWKSRIVLNNEILRGCKENGIDTNLFKIYLKYFRKIFEIIPLRGPQG